MAVLAHPDDESLGFGGTLAKYASEGVETFLVTATRGSSNAELESVTVTPGISAPDASVTLPKT